MIWLRLHLNLFLVKLDIKIIFYSVCSCYMYEICSAPFLFLILDGKDRNCYTLLALYEWTDKCFLIVFMPICEFFFHTTSISCLVLLHLGILSSVFLDCIFTCWFKMRGLIIERTILTREMHLIKWGWQISRWLLGVIFQHLRQIAKTALFVE